MFTVIIVDNMLFSNILCIHNAAGSAGGLISKLKQLDFHLNHI